MEQDGLERDMSTWFMVRIVYLDDVVGLGLGLGMMWCGIDHRKTKKDGWPNEVVQPEMK